MSSQKNILKNLLRKSMFTASTAAIMLANSSSFGAALVNRIATGDSTFANNVEYSSGRGLDGAQGTGTPFATNSLLTVQTQPNSTLFTNLPVPTTSMYIDAPGLLVRVGDNIANGSALNVPIGSIIASSPANYPILRSDLNGGNLILTGTGVTQAQAAGAQNINGILTPFAGGQEVPVNTYNVSDIVLGTGKGTMTIQANNQQVIEFTTFPTTLSASLNSILNIYTDLTVKDASWGDVTTIYMSKTNGVNSTFTIASDAGAVNFLQPAGGGLNFDENSPQSALIFAPLQAQSIIMKSSIVGAGEGAGIVTFDGTKGNIAISGLSGGEQLGLSGRLVDTVNIIGNITIAGGANYYNVSNTKQIQMQSGAVFADQSLTSGQAGGLYIGGVGNAAATYQLDAKYSNTGNFNLYTGGVSFKNADNSAAPNGLLLLESTATTAGTVNNISFASPVGETADLNPSANNTGIIQFNVPNAGVTLNVQGTAGDPNGATPGNVTIGANGNALNQMIFSGLGTVNLNQNINLNAQTALLNIANLTLGDITADVTYQTNTNFTVNSVTGNVDFAGNAGVLNLIAGGQLGTVESSAAKAGILAFAGGGQVGAITNLAAVNFNGAGNVNLNDVASATTFTINNAGVIVTAAGAVTGDIEVGAGTFNATAGGDTGNVTVGTGNYAGNITGGLNFTDAGTVNTTIITQAVDFAGKTAQVKVADGGQLNTITSSGGGAAAGTLNFDNGATVSGNISNLAAVNFNGAGAVALQGTSSANTFTINNPGVVVTAAGAVTPTIAVVVNDGTFNALDDVIGNVTIGAGTFAGDIDGDLDFIGGAGIVNATIITQTVDFAGEDGKINVAAGGQLNTITSSGGGAAAGTLNFDNGATVSGNISNLAAVNFNGAGAVALQGTSSANTFTINDPGVVVTATGAVTATTVATGAGTFDALAAGVTGNVTVGTGNYAGNITGGLNFTDAGTVNTTIITKAVDFAGKAAQVKVADGGNLATVTSSAAQAGTLTFEGDGTVGAVSNISTVSIEGDNNTAVTFQADVTGVTNFAFTDTGIAKMGGNFTADNVDFGGYAATLAFNGAIGGNNPANYTFNSPIANAGAATLNVDTTLIATDPTIGTFKTINIGAGGDAQTFTIATNTPVLNLLAAGGAINLSDPDSTFVLAPTGVQTVTFNGNLIGAGGMDAGIVNFMGNGTDLLTLQGALGGAIIGATNKLTVINISGNVTVLGVAGTNKLDVSGTEMLSIGAGSVFTDQSATSAGINTINIGVAGAATNAATYILDAINGDILNLDTGGMSFKNQASILQLQSSDAAGNNRMITLAGDLNPGGIGSGIVALNSVTANELLTIAGNVNLGIANGNTLNSVTFAGAGDITVVPTINTANPLSVGLGGALILSTVNNGINFTAPTNVTVDNVTGGIDYKGFAATVNVTAGGSVAGVTSSAVGGPIGNLTFVGAANVTGAVSNIAAITLNGAAGTIVNFEQSVSGGSLDFGGNGTAQFSGINPLVLNTPIANGANGTLNVFTNLTATDPSIGTVKTVNIGNNVTAQTFTIDVTKGALTLGNAVNFGNAASIFALTTSQNQAVTFSNSFTGIANSGGTVNLSSTSATTPNNIVLALQGKVGNETLGTPAAKLAAINISGNVAVAGTNVALKTSGLDISNTLALNIAAGGVLVDQSITSATIKTINIGDPNNGPAVYALDALNGDFPLDSKGVVFANPSSVFKLLTSVPSNETSTITLLGNIDPGAPHTGIVELSATNTKAVLKILGKFSLGTIANPLKQITFSGQGLFVLPAISTDNINLNTPGVALGDILSNVNFNSKSQLDTGSVTGNVDFQNNAGTIVLDSKATVKYPNATITGNIVSTGGPNGTVIFNDNGTIGTVDANGNSTTTITNLKMLQAGADNSTVTINSGGAMSIGEIQGTGTGDIVFATKTDLTGNINETGGSAVNVTFQNGGSIIGNVGNNTAVGNITVQNGTLSLGVPNSTPDSVIKGNTVYLSSGTNLVYNTSNVQFLKVLNAPAAPRAFNAFAITPAPIETENSVTFMDADPATYATQYGAADNPFSTLIMQGGNITLTAPQYITTINFTTTQAATLTFANTSQIGGATTNADNIHTIAISGDLTTGTAPFGDATNSLKSVQLLTGGKITIDSADFYSGITTNTNNTGTVTFNADNGFTDDLGDSSNSLNSVEFSSIGGTVKGDTYSQNITIDSGKSAIFSGYTSRTLAVPSATVNGTSVPRSIQQFTYQTLVSSSNFKNADGTSAASFTNASLVQAPISNGSLTFANDVWLQKPVTGLSTITFAPNKISIIGADVGATNIVADQANLVFLNSGDVSGNISGSNMTLDLGNNTINYTGNAKPTGELTINVFYDTTNAGATGNTDSGNIIIANGSNIDLSSVTSLKVLLTAASNPNSIGQGSAYPIITSLSESGITLGNAANLPFNVIANEGAFVRWVISSNSIILYPIELTNDVVTDNLIKTIIGAPINSDAAKVASVIVNTPVNQRKVVIDHILPIISRPSIEIHKITRPTIMIPDISIISSPITPTTSGNIVNNIFTPNGPAVVSPIGPNTNGPGGVVVGVGPSVVSPNGPGSTGTTGSNVGSYSPSVNGPSSTGTTGSNVGGYSPSVNGPSSTGTTGSNVGGYSPSVNGPGSTGTTGSNVGGYSPSVNGPGSTGTTGSNVGGYSPSVNGPGSTGTTGSNVGGYSPSVNGPGSTGTTGSNVGGYSPSVNGPGSTGTTGSNVGGYSPSVNGPSSTGTTGSNVGGYSPSVNGPSSTGTTGSNVGGYSPSVNGPGSTGTTGSNVGGYSPSVNGPGSTGTTGSNVGGYSPSVNGPGSTGTTGSNVGGYSPSVNGPSSTGTTGSNVGSYSPSVNGPGSTGTTGSNVGGYSPSVNGPGSTGTTGSNVGGYSPSVNGPSSTGTTGSNVGGYSPSVNGPSSTGTTGSNVGGYSPSVNGPGSTGTTGSNVGGYSPSVNGPSSTGTTGSNVGGYSPSVNGPGSTGTTGSNVGGYSPSVNGPGSTGTTGSNVGGYSPSVNGPGSTGTTGSNVGGYSPSVNGPSSTGITGSNVGGYSPSVNGPSSTGTTGSNVGGYSPSVNGPGSTGTTGSNVGGYSPSVNGPSSTGITGSNVGGYSPSVNGPGSTGTTGSNVGNYNPSVNGPSSTGTTGSNVGSYNPSVNGPGSTGTTGSNVGNYNPSVNGPSSTGTTGSNVGSYSPSATGGSSSSKIGSSAGTTAITGAASGGASVNTTGSNVNTGGYSVNNVGTSAKSPSATAIGGAANNNVPAAATNATNSNAIGGTSVNTNNGSVGTSGVSGNSGNNMPIIETGRDNSIGSSGNTNSGMANSGAASTGASTVNPSDGFDAARGNTNVGTKDVSDRTSKIRNAENASDSVPAEQDQGASRRRGAAVGGGDCDGDEILYGLWGAPYFGKAIQKAQHDLMGYKSKSAGGSIGLDATINDNIVVGAAYTKVDTKLSYQGAKAGNNTKVNTNMFSAYGLYNFINNWFAEGITSYSRSKIRTNEIRNIINGTETAHGKYHSSSYSGQVIGGYKYSWKDTTLSPMVGVRLSKIKDSGYREYGTSFQNLTIKKRQYNKIEGIAGGEIKTTFYKGEFLIRPQVHAFINYDFKGKTPAIIAELNGLSNPLPVPAPKATKMLYDLGAGVELKKGRMEYGFHYGLNIAKKYQSHSGTLKLKVNF